MIKNLFVAYLICAAVTALGLFLPWGSLLGFSFNGIESDDGKLVLALAVVIAIAAFLAKANKTIGALVLGFIAGVAAVITVAYDWMNLSDMGVSIGFGMVLCGIGAVATCYVSLAKVPSKTNTHV